MISAKRMKRYNYVFSLHRNQTYEEVYVFSFRFECWKILGTNCQIITWSPFSLGPSFSKLLGVAVIQEENWSLSHYHHFLRIDHCEITFPIFKMISIQTLRKFEHLK